jgi:hypothetical protein
MRPWSYTPVAWPKANDSTPAAAPAAPAVDADGWHAAR